MFFQKPVNQLEYGDIEQILLTGEPESIALDYKEGFSGSDRDKGELAKDVSAMANSQGGYIIIGVQEKGLKPIRPPVGIDKMVGRQNIEEWIEQVVAANIAQRVSVQIRRVDIPSSDKSIVVIHAPMSSRAPHMVTFQGDNRYYRRYFKRHQYQSLPAEEYEVREMFERSLRFTDQLMAYLQRKGYGDPTAVDFGRNTWSEHLYTDYTRTEGGSQMAKAASWVAFVACPTYLQDGAIDTSGVKFWQWLDPNLRRYPPDNGIFIPYSEKRATLEGVVHMKKDDGFLEEYLAVNANGYVEYGCNTARSIDGEWYFAFVPMMGRFWRFLGFIMELYSSEGLLRPFRVMLNMVGTKDSQLLGLGQGWLHAFSSTQKYICRSPEPNIQVIREIEAPILTASQVEELVRYFATKVDNAYGHREPPRCYNHPDYDPQRRFPVDKAEWYVGREG